MSVTSPEPSDPAPRTVEIVWDDELTLFDLCFCHAHSLPQGQPRLPELWISGCCSTAFIVL